MRCLEKVDAGIGRNAIHPNNVKRVIRALEFYEKTGRTISSNTTSRTEKKKVPVCNCGIFCA